MDELQRTKFGFSEREDNHITQSNPVQWSAPRISGQLAEFGRYQSVLAACNVHVIDEDLAQINCPGVLRHTNRSSPEDCIVYDNGGVLRATCFHTSCASEIDALNRRLHFLCKERRQFVPASGSFARQQQSAWQEKQRRRKALEQKAVDLRPLILAKYHWPADAIAAESPVEINLPVERQHRCIFNLFEDNDTLWCAHSVRHSGAYWHRKYFRKAARWAQEYRCPGAFICPNTFETGSYSRSDANFACRRFLVVESDTLSRNQVGAVFKWMHTCLGMSLRAIVDTGGRSLHAWFDQPSEGFPERLKVILRVLGCDPAMFRPAQPCRLPGIRRSETGRWQELLYLASTPSGAVGTDAVDTALPTVNDAV